MGWVSALCGGRPSFDPLWDKQNVGAFPAWLGWRQETGRPWRPLGRHACLPGRQWLPLPCDPLCYWLSPANCTARALAPLHSRQRDPI